MTKKAFEAVIAAKVKAVRDTINHRLPILIGRIATDFFKDSFSQGGFTNNGFHPWQKTQRQRAGSPHGPLLSERKYLAGSIRYVPGEARVVVGTTVPYAAVHNYGDTVTSHPAVTPKMRKFAWRRFFAAGGGKGNDTTEASKWKALALTKKQRLDITSHIPQRQFLGESKELTEKIEERTEKEIRDILNL